MIFNSEDFDSEKLVNFIENATKGDMLCTSLKESKIEFIGNPDVNCLIGGKDELYRLKCYCANQNDDLVVGIKDGKIVSASYSAIVLDTLRCIFPY